MMAVAMSATDLDTVSPSPGNPEPELFYELVSSVSIRNHRIVKPDSLSTPIYYIEKHESLLKTKFDLLFHQGDSKEGDVLGVVKMHLRGFTIGLGNPATETNEESGEKVIWEKLIRPQKMSHRTYYFDYGNSVGRNTFTYRKEYGTLKKLKAIELRAGGVEDMEGELLAKWVNDTKRSMKSGSLFIKRVEPKGRNQATVDEEARKWEMMVCLTTFAIIESQFRRSKG